MTAAQHSARIVLQRSGLFIPCRRAVGDGRGENRRAGWGLSSGGCASGHFRGRRRANQPDSEKVARGKRSCCSPPTSSSAASLSMSCRPAFTAFAITASSPAASAPKTSPARANCSPRRSHANKTSAPMTPINPSRASSRNDARAAAAA